MDTLREILDDVEKDIASIMKHAGNNYLRNFMETAYIEDKKLPLPEGVPPYKINKTESDTITKGVMWQFLKKLETLRNPKLHDLRREVMYIDALENVTEAEAMVLLHMKDQTLQCIYPNITLANLRLVGYFK